MASISFLILGIALVGVVVAGAVALGVWLVVRRPKP